MVNVSFIGGASCALSFFEEIVFEQALRERVYAHYSLLECDVDIVFTQGASVLDMGDVVDATRAVVAVKRSVEEAADCGGAAAHPCRLRPCCQHRRCFGAVKEQCVALAARRRRLEASLWAKWRELPSRKRCRRGQLETKVKLLWRVPLSDEEYDCLGTLQFEVAWRGLLKLSGPDVPRDFQTWVRQLVHDGEQQGFPCVGFVAALQCVPGVFAAFLGRRGAIYVSSISRDGSASRVCCAELHRVPAVHDVACGKSDGNAWGSGPPSLTSSFSYTGSSAVVANAFSGSDDSSVNFFQSLHARHNGTDSCVEAGWANKCLQNSIVRLLTGAERKVALAYFRRVCANDVGCGHSDGDEERANFTRVLWFLVQREAFVWVYEPEGVADFRAWRLGVYEG